LEEIHIFCRFLHGELPMTGCLGAPIRSSVVVQMGCYENRGACDGGLGEPSPQQAIPRNGDVDPQFEFAGDAGGEEPPPGRPAKDADDVEGDASEAGFHGSHSSFEKSGRVVTLRRKKSYGAPKRAPFIEP
jgi:hypothetical protein